MYLRPCFHALFRSVISVMSRGLDVKTEGGCLFIDMFWIYETCMLAEKSKRYFAVLINTIRWYYI